MLYRIEHLCGYTLQATDGDIGSVDDLMFDDRLWRIRYVVVDTGGWLSSRRVLISSTVLDRPDRLTLKLPVSITRGKVRESPQIDADAPVTREQEELLRSHYGWMPWWTEPAFSVGLLGLDPIVMNNPPEAPPPQRLPSESEARLEAGLRSAHEVTGFHIAATDGDIGHVEDLLVDEDGWMIRYLIVDTRNWLPGRKVLIAPSWVSGVDWLNEKVAMQVTREKIKGSPEYAPEKEIDRRFEHDLHTWYGHAPYW
jgi:uncharacterized protein YrrD